MRLAVIDIGQDLSERLVQFRGLTPQFWLGKSFPGFCPSGQQMQKGRTADLIFSVPHLIESLSAARARQESEEI